MANEIIGNSYRYIIDESYGIDKDGFIAKGTESIVYKGLKTKLGGGLQFSCVLKFKPRRVTIDGKVVDRMEAFKEEEWKIFEELRECRSIVRIDDVIDLPNDFTMPCPKISGGAISGAAYFCVVEEFIDGWNLDEFCREEYWKLRRIEPIEHGVSRVVEYKDFTAEEKKTVLAGYTYDNILKYQNQILLFMINLCEIMEFVTGQKNVLHLDIKPENIMVTRHGKELVLIDFGRSKRITKATPYVQGSSEAVDYNINESMDKLYQYGTLGYAAPECFKEAAEGSEFPFGMDMEHGRMSVESDIFSFGATFWECLNIFELVTKNPQFKGDTHDFYREYFMSDDAYCNRDLSFTSATYHKKLELVLRKCTRTRSKEMQDSDRYYHSYRELRRDVENVKDSVPTIEKEENVKAKNAFQLCGVMLALCLILLVIYSIYHAEAYDIAQRKWNTISSNYNDTQFYRLEEVADDLITTAPGNRINNTYEEIAAFTYQENDISEYEAEMLVALLQKVNNKNQLPERVDEIMCHGNTRKFKEISTQIMKLGEVKGSTGYELAKAIYNVEVAKTGVVDAYKTLQTYQYEDEFKNAVIKLRNVLDNDESIQEIAESEGISRQEVQRFFSNIDL